MGILLLVQSHKIITVLILLPVLIAIIVLIIWKVPSLYGSKVHSLQFDGIERKYLLHLPSNYDLQHTYPLVVVVHGYGNNPKQVEWYTGFSKKADIEGFIAVYPRGYSKYDPMWLVWNAGFCCHNGEEKQADDVGFIKALIEEMQKLYPIDAKRIYVTGFSNGGMMTHRIGVELSGIVTAIAPISGAISGETKHMKPGYMLQTPKDPLPVLIMHGEKDMTIPYKGEANGRDTFSSVDETVAFWVQSNGCFPISQEEVRRFGQVTKKTYTGCRNNTQVVLYTLANSKHIWSGGNYDKLKHPFARNINATNTIWDFFKTYSE